MLLSLYLHIPFCRHRCAYCDFNTYAGLDDLKPAYVKALADELEGVAESAASSGGPMAVHTVFFGGGTPSLLSQDELRSLLTRLRQNFDLQAETEITLEANPTTVDLAWLMAAREQGVNRLSLGMQSSHAAELRLLERQHAMADVQTSVAWARKAGFDNLNLDLIYGLPQQTLAGWGFSLTSALALEPDHLSLYALSLEFGTPMRKRVEAGQLPPPDPDLAADMYDMASAELKRAGYIQYEISNWARPGPDGQPRACRHNLQIWRNQEYLGLGAGAHGCARGWRTRDVRSPRAYIDRLERGAWREDFPFTPATAWREWQSKARRAEDTMILGLRLTVEGVSAQGYAASTGRSMEEDFGAVLDELMETGLLERDEERIRLSQRGRLLGNQVFARFVGRLSDIDPAVRDASGSASRETAAK